MKTFPVIVVIATSAFAMTLIGCDSKPSNSLDTKSPASSANTVSVPVQGSESTQPTGSSTAQPQASKNSTLSPADATRHKLSVFEFHLPKHFKAIEIPLDRLPPNLMIAGFQSLNDAGEPKATISFMIMDSADEAKKSAADPRKQMVNFARGNFDRKGIKIAKYGEVAIVDWNGLSANKMSLLLQMNDQMFGGAVYSLVFKDRSMLILHSVFDGAPDIVMPEMEAALSTMKAI